MIYGYARVSTDGQSLDAQLKQLRAAGAEKVLRETASGAQTNRAQFAGSRCACVGYRTLYPAKVAVPRIARPWRFDRRALRLERTCSNERCGGS
jgi:predicted site-specific integrase-resolvase